MQAFAQRWYIIHNAIFSRLKYLDGLAPLALRLFLVPVFWMAAARDILQEHGNYPWLTEKGGMVILNNGIEFGVIYLLMLFSLLFTGGGRFTSVDYYLTRLWPDRS